MGSSGRGSQAASSASEHVCTNHPCWDTELAIAGCLGESLHAIYSWVRSGQLPAWTTENDLGSTGCISGGVDLSRAAGHRARTRSALEDEVPVSCMPLSFTLSAGPGVPVPPQPPRTWHCPWRGMVLFLARPWITAHLGFLLCGGLCAFLHQVFLLLCGSSSHSASQLPVWQTHLLLLACFSP